MLTQAVLAYTAFILIGALPVLVPVAAAVLLAAGVVLLARHRGALRIAGLMCIGAAGFLALIVFQIDDAVPGTQSYREVSASVALQQQAQRAYEPGGYLSQLRPSKRRCSWEKTASAWEKKCVDEN